MPRTLEETRSAEPRRDTHAQVPARILPLQKAVFWLPFPLLIGLLVTVSLLGERVPSDAPVLLFVLNLVFISLMSLFMSFLLARSFTLQGSPPLLLFGCGLLLWGIYGMMAIALSPRNGNTSVTIRDLTILLSAACQFAGALLSLEPDRRLKAPPIWLASAYSLSLATVALIGAANSSHWPPAFVLPNGASTPTRQMIVLSSAALLILAAAVLAIGNRAYRTGYLRWYVFGLLLSGCGLWGPLLEPGFGAGVEWAARASRYLGAVYLLAGTIGSVRESRQWGITVEQSLHEVRKQYRDLLENAADGVLVSDFAESSGLCCIVEANPAICALLGYSKDELQSKTILDVVPEKDRAAVSEDGRSIAIKNILRHELTLVTREGREIAAEVSSRLFLDEGRTRVLSVVRDVTARREAEQRLRELSQRLAYHVENTPLAVIEWGPDRRLVRWSSSAARMFGWTAEEVLGKLVEDLHWVHEGDREQVRAVGDRLESGNLTQQFSANRNYRKDGTVLDCEWYNSSLLDERGRVVSILSLVLDVTARKRAEVALRDSEQRFESFMNATPVLAWIKNTAGRYLYINHAWSHEFGLKPADCLGKTAFDLMDNGVAEKLAVNDLRVLETGHPLVAIEHTGGGLAGATRIWHAVKFPFRVSSGEMLLGGTAVNITEQKQTEERLRHAQKLESIGLLAGGIAHDFNNLLVGVMGNASLAESMLPEGHAALELLRNVIKSGERAAHLTRQLLAYAGKGRFVVEPIDLGELITAIHSLVRLSIPGKVTVQLDLPQDVPRIMADSGQVQQVVMNLLLNAGEAIGNRPGSIGVSIGAESLEAGNPVELAPGEYVYLEVRDTGSGMDEATKAKIFDPFFTTKFTGRGLGLAAVAGIVRAHRGAIQVTSELGNGSSFKVYFPSCSTNRTQSSRRVSATLPVSQPGATVLVVDDEASVVGIAREALKRAGYSVLTAESGERAIEVLVQNPGGVQLVLLDLSMPGLSGAETLVEIRRICPDVKVLTTSGYSEDEGRKLTGGESVAGFVQKPYTIRALTEAVFAALQK